MANRLGLHAPVAEQPHYSMLHRENFEASLKVGSSWGCGFGGGGGES